MKSLPLSLLLLLATVPVFAQDALSDSAGSASNAPSSAGSGAAPSSSGNFYAWWSARTNATQAKQPAWAVPLVTTYTGLFQVVRTDIVRQIAPARTLTWNYDNSKGVNFIPGGNIELAFDLPPYIQHNTTAVNGWGDFSFLAKYRFISGNAQHGNYDLSFWVLTTVPTGQAKNGSTNASVQPNLGGGKGFGNFDVVSTIGATLPTGNPANNSAGRPVLWNTVAQYKVAKLFWPELESNATFYKGGTNDGKIQEFITPGLIVGRCGLHPNDAKSRPGLAFGGGMQFATSRFHTYNHSLILTARWIF
jgi:hypothetical protein